MISEYSSPEQVLVAVIGIRVAALSLITRLFWLFTPDASTLTKDKSKLAHELQETEIRPSTQSDLDYRYM